MEDPITYNALDHFIYIVTYDGITFKLEGAQDGDFITVTYDNDSVTGAEGAQGDVQWSQRIPSLGTVVFTGQWGSDSNGKMNQVHKDQISGNFPQKMQIKRINDSENVLLYDTSSCRVMKGADLGLGSVAAPRAWSFKVGGLSEEEVTAPV